MISNTIESLKPTTAAEKSDSESRSSRDFYRIASLGTALGFGTAAASTASLCSSSVGFSFQLSVATFVAFVVGAAVGLIYWRLVASNSKAARRASFLIALAGVGLFLYPLRFVPAGNLHDLIIGLILAACALSIVGFLLWRVKRFLDKDSQQSGEETDQL
jgi:FtsH-binding integral membrane protein